MAGEGSCPADPDLGNGADDWGCTYDNITELTWEMKTADGGLHDEARRYTNKGRGSQDVPSDAAFLVKATNEEALCGSRAWRLPDPIELQSIVDYGDGQPDRDGACLDPIFFPATRRAYHWTRTESVWDAKSAWYVEGCGRIGATKRFDDYLAARLVHRKAVDLFRRQWATQKERFIPSADGLEVTDTMTGLIWRRCAEGTEWNRDAQTCEGIATQFEWRDAFDHVRANRQGGWRLPNIKELFSIVDFKRQDPALNPVSFPNAPDWTFLSSTPIDYAVPHFQVVYFSRGAVEQQDANKSYDWALRLVRGGRK